MTEEERLINESYVEAQETELLKRNMKGIIQGFDRQRSDDDDRQNDVKALQLSHAMLLKEIEVLKSRINTLQYGQVLGSTA